VKKEEIFIIFEEYLKTKSLRMTKQRNDILVAVLNSQEHLSADLILEKVKQYDSSIGLATVYRTLQLLNDSGIIEECAFAKERGLYEVSVSSSEHHDHMICTRCGKIVEFHDEELEKMQEKIAKQLGFGLKSHKVVLYGECLKPCEPQNHS